VRRLTLETAGTFLVVLIALGVVVMVCLSAAFSLASEDLYASVDQAQGKVTQRVRSQPGIWLSSRFSADLESDALDARHDRADQLAYRSERVREAAAVPALAGLVVALLTAKPVRAEGRGLDTSSPAANTTNNGRV
jgi:hypothetical protein